MKSRFRHNILLGLMLVAAFVSLVPTSVFAEAQSAYLAPASGTTQTGNTFTVSVDGYVTNTWWWWVEVGSNSAKGSLSFPVQNLKVTSISTAGSSFPSGTPTFDNSTGQIDFNLSSGSTSYTNQSVHLFSITFQATGPGNAGVSFTSCDFGINTTTTSGGTYTINSPPPPTPSPSPTPKPSPKPSTKPTATPTPTPTPIATPTPEDTPAPVVQSDGGLKIENVKVTATRSENSVTWSLNNAAAVPTFAYGTSKDALKDGGEVPLQDDGTYKATLQNLNPGTLYYFTIKAATSDNLQGATYSGVLTTRGYPVQLTIEQNDLQIPGAKVKIGARTFVANKDAIVTAELSDGDFTAEITAPGETDAHKVTFTVKKLDIPDGGNPALQSFTLNITTIGSSPQANGSIMPIVIGGAAAGVAAIGGIAGFLLFLRRRNSDRQTSDSVDVDTGQLQQAYGRDVGNYMTNTPEPNLGGGFVSAPQPTDTATTVIEQQPQPTVTPTPESGQAQAVDLAMQQPVVAQTEQEIQPLPQIQAEPALPPASIDNSAQDLSAQAVEPIDAVPQPAPQIQPYADQPTQPTEADNAALAQEVTRVESSEQIVDTNEPSAVYDASTGELAIIHHHDTGTQGISAPTQQGAV